MEFEVVESVSVDAATRVLVAWVDQGSGFYEFSIEKGGDVLEVSDRQYGNPVAALRDGLSSWLGDL